MVEQLRVQALTRTFGGLHAVDGVDLSIERGSVVGLIGPNGAGKSTLFHLVAGALAPSSGSIWYEGENITPVPAHGRARRGISRSFQSLGLAVDESVLDNVLAKLHAMAGYRAGEQWLRPLRSRAREAGLREEARHWIAAVGLSKYAHSPITSLSFGLARRAELAGVLAMRPKLLMMDEPTAGLSIQASHELFDLLTRVRAEREMTLLIIGHDIGFIMSFVEELAVMADGKLIARGAPTEVAVRPDVVEAYLGTRHVGTDSARGRRRRRPLCAGD